MIFFLSPRRGGKRIDPARETSRLVGLFQVDRNAQLRANPERQGLFCLFDSVHSRDDADLRT